MKLKRKESNQLLFSHSMLPFFIVGSAILGLSVIMPFIIKNIPLFFSWISMIAGICMFILALIVFPFKTEVIFNKMSDKLTIKEVRINQIKSLEYPLSSIQDIEIIKRVAHNSKGHITFRIEVTANDQKFPLVKTYINDKKLLEKSLSEIKNFLK